MLCAGTTDALKTALATSIQQMLTPPKLYEAQQPALP